MILLDPTDAEIWQQVRATLRRTTTSSLHCALATTGADGSPHITPIGSVMLTKPGQAVYLDVINVELSRNLDRDPRVTLLAVDSGRRTWASALLRGRFATPPGVRLIGTAGPSRPATPAEIERFQRRVGFALRTKGGSRLWGRSDRFRARDLAFTGVAPVRLPHMTAHLWPAVRPGSG